MDHHVRILLQHFLGIRGNAHTPRRIRCADHFAEVTPHFRGIGIDGADNFNGLFFSHQARDGCANRAHTVLDGANFLFHVVLHSPGSHAHNAHFRCKKKPLR